MAPTSPPPSDDNPSYTRLKRDLGADAPLLNFLPFRRVIIQPQTELAGAGPDRILYGDMMDGKDELWIYFTLRRGNSGHDATKMVSFYTLKGARSGRDHIRADRVLKVALPSLPFKHARNHYAVMAIAKYFFIRHGIDSQLKWPLVMGSFIDDVLRACRDYQRVYDQMKGEKKAASVANAAVEPDISPSQHSSINSSRKRASSTTPLEDTHHEPHRPTTRITTSPSYPQASQERISNIDPKVLAEQYVSLQAEEEKLDEKLMGIQAERSGFRRQMDELQASLKALEDRKLNLEDQKNKVRVKKHALQGSLGPDEQLQFGFEAGRLMERKRLKKA
jgi:hypothetical protein